MTTAGTCTHRYYTRHVHLHAYMHPRTHAHARLQIETMIQRAESYNNDIRKSWYTRIVFVAQFELPNCFCH